MKIGFNSVTLDKDNFENVFKKINNFNYETIELNAETLPWASPHLTDKTSNEELEKIKILSSKYNLEISSIGAHIDLSSNNEKVRIANVDYVKKCIEHAKKISCPIVHILSGELKQIEKKEQKLELFYDSVKILSKYGLKNKIKIGIEAIVGHVFHSHLDFEVLWKKLGDENIWVNYDPSHYEAQKINIADTLALLGSKIIHVHMKDAMGKFPYFQFPPLGKGNIDFNKMIKQLKAINYNGVLSAEYEAQVFGWELNEQDILKTNYEFIKNILK
jgi:sugar phosphate isomerase/epimerase